MPGTWAGTRGEKPHAENFGGLLEPGRAEERDEVAAERVKNTPPSGKTQTLVYWGDATSHRRQANVEGREERLRDGEDGNIGVHVEAGGGSLQEESG